MNVKNLYNSGVNIQKYFREQNKTNVNDTNAILYSYDFQAGSYTQEYLNEEVIDGLFTIDGKKVSMTEKQWMVLQSQYLAEELAALQPKNVLEVGIGEATRTCNIILNMDDAVQFSGLELSLSRLFYASKFADYNKVKINLAMGNMFSMPYLDNSFDVVLLIHCLESNTGREREALKEFLRVTNKYLVMLEPSYELGNEETRQHIKELCYIDNLQKTINELGLNVIKNELFKVSTYSNNAAITIIKKEKLSEHEHYLPSGNRMLEYACPCCKAKLHQYLSLIHI